MCVYVKYSNETTNFIIKNVFKYLLVFIFKVFKIKLIQILGLYILCLKFYFYNRT